MADLPESLMVVETPIGYFSYHLADQDHPYRSLCGVHTMETSIPLTYWNKTPEGYHIREKWCEKCEKLALDLVNHE